MFLVSFCGKKVINKMRTSRTLYDWQILVWFLELPRPLILPRLSWLSRLPGLSWLPRLAWLLSLGSSVPLSTPYHRHLVWSWIIYWNIDKGKWIMNHGLWIMGHENWIVYWIMNWNFTSNNIKVNSYLNFNALIIISKVCVSKNIWPVCEVLQPSFPPTRCEANLLVNKSDVLEWTLQCEQDHIKTKTWHQHSHSAQ